jgi:hypothetical protein
MLEKHMRDACYSVAETAEMAGVTETRLRDWIARTPISPLGTKPKGRIFFSGFEVFVWRIARDLVDAGYAPHAAVMTAFRAAGGPYKRAPQIDQFALVGTDCDAEFIDRRGTWAELAGAARTGIAVPLWAHWTEISAKAVALYGGA